MEGELGVTCPCNLFAVWTPCLDMKFPYDKSCSPRNTDMKMDQTETVQLLEPGKLSLHMYYLNS